MTPESIIAEYIARGSRVIIIGAARTGKSTLSKPYIGRVPVRCGDPERDVKDPLPGVEYAPESYLGQFEERERWSATSQWVADNWLDRPGPWICEGVGMPRALRKYMNQREEPPPCNLVVYVRRPPFVPHLRGQAAQGKGADRVFKAVRGWIERASVPIVEVW